MHLVAFHTIEAFRSAPSITWRHLEYFCYPKGKGKGKVEPHLECSIDLVLYSYFTVHHWKMSFLNGTPRKEVTLVRACFWRETPILEVLKECPISNEDAWHSFIIPRSVSLP
jgi:hypothetical protein